MLRSLAGPFASPEEACAAAGGEPCEIRTGGDRALFLKAKGAWWVALGSPKGDGWRIGRVPLDDAVEPRRVEVRPPLIDVRLMQHAFSTAGVDQDGEWLWPCTATACAATAIPLSVRDRSRDTDVEIVADVAGVQVDRARPGDPLVLDVVVRKLRIFGHSARADEWRARTEALRGHHVLPLP